MDGPRSWGGRWEAEARRTRTLFKVPLADKVKRSQLNPPREARLEGQITETRPCVLASWEQYPSSLTDDHYFAGAKATGLFKLPKSWVPRFFVLTSAFQALVEKETSVTRALRALPKADQDLIDEFFADIIAEQGGSAKVLVRSNSTVEDLTVRGAYKSYTVKATEDALPEAITAILAVPPTEPMCALVQLAIEPGWLGHMSNERRVSPKRTSARTSVTAKCKDVRYSNMVENTSWR